MLFCLSGIFWQKERESGEAMAKLGRAENREHKSLERNKMKGGFDGGTGMRENSYFTQRAKGEDELFTHF